MEPEAAEADDESSDSFATAERMCTGAQTTFSLPGTPSSPIVLPADFQGLRCRTMRRRTSGSLRSRIGSRSGFPAPKPKPFSRSTWLSARNLAAPSSARQSTGRTKGASVPGHRFASNRIPTKRLRPCLLRRLRKSTCVAAGQIAGADLGPVYRAVSGVGQTAIDSVAALISTLVAIVPWLPVIALIWWAAGRGVRRWRAQRLAR